MPLVEEAMKGKIIHNLLGVAHGISAGMLCGWLLTKRSVGSRCAGDEALLEDRMSAARESGPLESGLSGIIPEKLRKAMSTRKTKCTSAKTTKK